MKRKFLLTGTSAMPEGKIVYNTSDTYGNILTVDYSRYRVTEFIF